MLVSYGPQAPTGFCNGPSSAEYQGECVIETLLYMRQHAHSRFNVTAEAENHWRALVLELAEATLFPQADSWYMGANIPGKPKEMLMYAGGLPGYLKEFRKCVSDNYRGFSFH
jgi:cyclohexanone monooxygenase